MDDGLTWWPLVRDVTRRSKAKIWSLLKLRMSGASTDQLVALYIARVRGTLEYGAQVFGTVLNASQSDELEAVQVKSLQIVLGSASSSYARNLEALGMVTLAERRLELIKSFAISCYKSVEHRWWFTPQPLLILGLPYLGSWFPTAKGRGITRNQLFHTRISSTNYLKMSG